MDAVSSMAKSMMQRKDDDNFSEMTESDLGGGVENVISYEMIQGMDESKNKDEPVRGRKYMLFSLAMMLFLTIFVAVKVDSATVYADIKNNAIKERDLVPEKKAEPVTPPVTPPTEPEKTKPTTPTEEETKPKEQPVEEKTEEKKTEETKETEEETKPTEGE